MILKSISEDINRILHVSSHHARKYHQSQLSLEHMMLAILDDPDNSGARLLKKLGVDEIQLRRELESRMSYGANMFQMGKVPRSDEVARVLTSAEKMSNDRKGTLVRSADLMLALLRCTSGPVAVALQACGFNYAMAAKEAVGFARHILDERRRARKMKEPANIKVEPDDEPEQEEDGDFTPDKLFKPIISRGPAPLTPPQSSTTTLISSSGYKRQDRDLEDSDEVSEEDDYELVDEDEPEDEDYEYEEYEEYEEEEEEQRVNQRGPVVPPLPPREQTDILTAEPVGDNALLELIDRWPQLPLAVRKGILATSRVKYK